VNGDTTQGGDLPDLLELPRLRSDLSYLRGAARALLDAEQAHRMSPTLENASLLTRARRGVEDVLKDQEPSTRER
jgi:hypothetical protein